MTIASFWTPLKGKEAKLAVEAWRDAYSNRIREVSLQLPPTVTMLWKKHYVYTAENSLFSDDKHATKDNSADSRLC
jgi:hypothetical protein